MRQLLADVYGKVVLAFGIFNGYHFFSVGECTAIAYLTTHLGIEGSTVENDLIELLIFLFHLAVTQNLGIALCEVVAYKLGLAFAQCYPVTGLYGGGIAGTTLLLLHLGIELIDIHSHIVLLEDKLGKVEGESVCVV